MPYTLFAVVVSVIHVGKNKGGYVLSAEPAPEKLYNYCPICGSRKTKYMEDVKKIDKYSWDE